MVPNVKVWVTNNATSVRREAVSNKEGSFVFASLEPGSYSLRAEAPGFVAFEVSNITLNTSDRRQIEIRLKVGATSETVTVSADSVAVEISPAVSTVVDSQFVSNIPLNGRTFQNLIYLTPGVVPTGGPAGTPGDPGQFSVNGQRTSANYFTVDGVSANVAASGQVASNQGYGGSALSGSEPTLTSAGTTASMLSVDEMDEFRIQTSNYAPEFGRTPGAQVQLTTRSGGNKFHGSASEYFRNDVLDARDWFQDNLGLPKTPLRQNDFDVTFGGPLWVPGASGDEKTTFFFLSYEGARLRVPQILHEVVPSLQFRQDPMVSPLALPYLNDFVVPNGQVVAGTDGLWQNYSGVYSNSNSTDTGAMRLDHHLGQRATLFTRYSYSDSSGLSHENYENVSPLQHNANNAQTLTAGLTTLFSPTLVDEFRVNYTRDGSLSVATPSTFGGAVPVPAQLVTPYAGQTPDNSSLQIGIGTNSSSGISSFDFMGEGINFITVNKQFNLVNSVSKSVRGHEIKAGVDYRRLFPTSTQGAGYLGLSFFAYCDFQTNPQPGPGCNPVPTSPSFSDVFYSQYRQKFRPVYSNTALYVQDTWKTTRRLTLTYGLRWDYNPSPKDAGSAIPIFLLGDDVTNLTLAPYGSPLYHVGAGAFAPRFGLSFAVRQDPKWATVLRGGVGSFYDLGNNSVSTALNSQNYPFSASSDPSDFGTIPQPLPLPALGLQPPPPVTHTPPFAYGSSFAAFTPDYKLPRTWQWNVALQQSIGEKQELSLTYVGNDGQRLLNQRQLTASATDPNFPGAFVTSNASQATSSYNALQTQFQRQLSHGLQVLASYSWAHAIDEVSDAYSLVLLRASSDFDIRHTFTTAFSYDIPHPVGAFSGAVLSGWAIEGIFQARSARPVSVVLQNGQTFFASGKFLLAYPDLVPGVPPYLYGSQYPGGKAINNTPGPVCPNQNPNNPFYQVGPFCPPPGDPNNNWEYARNGDFGRNGLRGFGMNQMDFSLRRDFHIYENLHLQFKGDLFNIFNHPNFADPQASIGISPFGVSQSTLANQLSGSGLSQIYSEGGPRSIQLSLKLIF
jgi:hypothetical protein